MAQADALMLADGDSGKLSEMLPALSPLDVDFGRRATVPIEQIGKLWREFRRMDKE